MTDSYDIITLEEFINRHPEIEQFEIFKIWDSAIVSEGRDCDLVRVSGYGKTFDEEYSYIGGRAGALEFCRICDCWEEVHDTLENVSEFGITQSYDADSKRFSITQIEDAIYSEETMEFVPDSQFTMSADIEVYIDDFVRVEEDLANTEATRKKVEMGEFISGHEEIGQVVDLHVVGFHIHEPLSCNGGSWNCIRITDGTCIERCIVSDREGALKKQVEVADSTEPRMYWAGAPGNEVAVTQRIIGNSLVRIAHHTTERKLSHMPERTVWCHTTLRFGPFDDHNRAAREVVF